MGQDVADGRLVGGRYRLEGVLGRGGMGTVWRGRDETLGRTVAVKELRFPSSVEEDEKQRLVTRTLREAKAIARIRSGSAVTVFDVVDEDGRPWIVMELIEGRSLADHIGDDGPLTPRRAAEVGLSVLDVLRAAHREGILHRDVKPSNVLLEEDTGRVVLTDFGIAKVEGDPSVTSTGMLVGAPSYISPERARGKPPGPPADLWSLGALLYAAVEGRPPYDKGSALSTLTAVMTEPLRPPEQAGELGEVVLGLLEKDPDKRLDVDGARALLQEATLDVPADATRMVPLPPAPPEEDAGDAAAEPEAGSRQEPDTGAAEIRAGTPKAVAASPEDGGSGGDGPAGTRRGGALAALRARTSRRTLAVVAAVVVVLAVLGTVIALAGNGEDPGQNAAQGGAGTGEDSGKDAKDPDKDSGDRDDGAGQEPGGSGDGKDAGDDRGDDKGGDGKDGGLPDGYRTVEDTRFAFSMAMPEGFELTGVAGQNSGGKYGSPGGGYPKIQVDHTTSPGTDALAAWKDLEPSTRNSSSGYRRLSMEEVKWRGYPTVADWQFARTEDGRQVRVLNRGFKVDGDDGYAILVTCKADAWDGKACKTLRETAFRTFRPS